MRTTLDIEDDVLQAAKELAGREGSTAGRVLSTLARRGLTVPIAPSKGQPKIKNGVPLLPSSGEIITLEHVQRLMDSEGI